MADGAQKRNEPRKAEDAFGTGFLRDIWYPAAMARDLKPGAMKKIEFLGEPVVFGRTRKGEVFALRDICPHRAAPLSAGRMVKEEDGSQTIECPYHGWRFRPGGQCAAIPSLVADQQFEVERIRVRKYPTAERQGIVYIYAPSDPRFTGEPDLAPPEWPGVVGGGPKVLHQTVFDAHIDHAVVGLIDPAHGPYVHQQWWWRTSRSAHEKKKKYEARPMGFAMARHEPSKNSYAYNILGGEPLTDIMFNLPGVNCEHIQVGKMQVLSLTLLMPMNDRQTQVIYGMWSDHPAFTLLRPFIRFGALAFLRQDVDMVNLQNEGLKYDASLLWINDADQMAKWYRQLKREWTESRAEGRPLRNPVETTQLRWRS